MTPTTSPRHPTDRNTASPDLLLTQRPRRLRRTPAVRDLVRETRLTPNDLVYPLFVCAGRNVRREVASMPGVFQLSVDTAVREAADVQREGIRAVLLFGLPEHKDETGSSALDPDAPVQSAVRANQGERLGPPCDHRRVPLRVHIPRPLRDRRR